MAVQLLKLGLDTVDHKNGLSVQDVAQQNGHYDVIFALYKENVQLPKSIDMKKCPEDFKNFLKLLEKFNKLIMKDNLEEIKEIYHQLPKTRNFYNLANESALKVAIENTSFSCYEFFLSEKLLFAPHESPEEYFDDLIIPDQVTVREIHNKYTQELQEKHTNVLLSKSFIAHDGPDAKEKLRYIHRTYEALNSNFLIKIILMIVAASKNFKIIFDFNRESVNIADPTADSSTQGQFYPSGRIYIGAKQLLNKATANETIATVAHELCHCAMNIVYDNKAKPYKSDNQEVMQEFEEISKICKKNSGIEKIIDRVFECYSEKVHHAELIVRVVHVLAFYGNGHEKLEQIRTIFGCLFEFYENRTVPEIQDALRKIEERDEEELRKKDRKISKLKKISLIGGVLSVIGIIAAICIGFIFYTPTYSFKDMTVKEQKLVMNASVIYKNTSIKFHDLFPENSTAYESLTSDHISQMLHFKTLNLSDSHFHYLGELITHNWNNLTQKLKEKILTSNFTFQNETLELQNLYELNPEAFGYLKSDQIIEVLDGKSVTTSKRIRAGYNVISFTHR